MRFLTGSLYSLEQFLIMIFTIHRVLLLVREHWIKKFYIVFTPIVLAYSAVLGFARATSVGILFVIG
nr:unnamed protein product [Haemonchus contortus]